MKSLRAKSGFTMVEMLIMVGIIGTLSVLVLFSSSGLRGDSRLNRSARELALNIRAAQNSAIAINIIPDLDISPSTGGAPPPAVGLQLQQGSARYIYFADRDDLGQCLNTLGKRDSTYTTPNVPPSTCDELIKTYSFDQNVKVNNINVDGVPVGANEKRNILFAAPEAGISFTDESGNSLGSPNRVEIELIAESGSRKSVTVWVSGQISVK